LKKASVAVNYAPSDEITYGVVEGYEWLLRNPKSNLGWRILAEVCFDEIELRRIVQESEKGIEIGKLLDAGFVTKHQRVLELIRAIRKEELALLTVEAELKSVLDTGSNVFSTPEFHVQNSAQQSAIFVLKIKCLPRQDSKFCRNR
jgi:hypothetical protein